MQGLSRLTTKRVDNSIKTLQFDGSCMEDLLL